MVTHPKNVWWQNPELKAPRSEKTLWNPKNRIDVQSVICLEMCISTDESEMTKQNKVVIAKRFFYKRNLLTMTTQMTREELNYSRLQEIASFYSNPAEAMAVLNKWMALDKETRKCSVKGLLERQRKLFLKRVANKVKATTDLLELELDPGPAPRPIPGYSLGLAAYQAEMEYHGGRRFTE